MKKQCIYALCGLLMFLSACGQAVEEKEQESERQGGLYATVVHYTGENESEARYLEIAGRSQKLLALLEENCGGFVMDAYNYQSTDEEGTPLYTMNTHSYPVEIAPTGYSIRVSRNYFVHNPIETADGSDLTGQLVYNDLTLNLLVPEQYRDREEEIAAAYRERFYFEKVTAENDYNEMAGIPDRLELNEEDLNIHIIYVKDGQKYFTFRADCAQETGNWIKDPVVQVYTGNIHCNYAHSFLSQWFYLPFEGTPEEAYESIRPWVEDCGAGESVQRVELAYEPQTE